MGDTLELSGDAHDRLRWYQREDEDLDDTLDRLLGTLPGPSEFQDAGVSPPMLDGRTWVLWHSKTAEGQFRSIVYNDPLDCYLENEEAIDAMLGASP